MEPNFEVVVIGAGIMGSTCAYYLSKEFGSKVMLLEQFDFLHKKGSSHGDSRITRMTYPQQLYTSLMGDAFKLWEEAQNDFESKVLTMTGGLDFGKRDNKNLCSLMESADKYNVEYKIMTPTEVKEKYPQVNLPKDFIAIYTKKAGILNATKAVSMFQNGARKNGCQLRDNSSVDKISEVGNLIKIKLASGEEILTKKIVLTVGAWAKKFLKKNYNLDLPLRPVKATVGYYKVENPELYSSKNFPVFINYDGPLLYGLPAHEYPNMIKCAAHHGPEVDPDTRDFIPGFKEIEKEIKPYLTSTFEGVCPDPVFTETCLYTVTPEEDFVIDKLPTNNNIVIGCGFSGHGFKMGPLVGKILSHLIIYGENPYPHTKKVFSIERFNKM